MRDEPPPHRHIVTFSQKSSTLLRRAGRLSWRQRGVGGAALVACAAVLGLPPLYAAALATLPWLLLPEPR